MELLIRDGGVGGARTRGMYHTATRQVARALGVDRRSIEVAAESVARLVLMRLVGV